MAGTRPSKLPGQYIPDFCAVEPKLTVELDGSQYPKQGEHNEERTEYLELQGYRVIRFWKNQIRKDNEGEIPSILSPRESNESGADD